MDGVEAILERTKPSAISNKIVKSIKYYSYVVMYTHEFWLNTLFYSKTL